MTDDALLDAVEEAMNRVADSLNHVDRHSRGLPLEEFATYLAQNALGIDSALRRGDDLPHSIDGLAWVMSAATPAETLARATPLLLHAFHNAEEGAARANVSIALYHASAVLTFVMQASVIARGLETTDHQPGEPQ